MITTSLIPIAIWAHLAVFHAASMHFDSYFAKHAAPALEKVTIIDKPFIEKCTVTSDLPVAMPKKCVEFRWDIEKLNERFRIPEVQSQWCEPVEFLSNVERQLPSVCPISIDEPRLLREMLRGTGSNDDHILVKTTGPDAEPIDVRIVAPPSSTLPSVTRDTRPYQRLSRMIWDASVVADCIVCASNYPLHPIAFYVYPESVYYSGTNPHFWRFEIERCNNVLNTNSSPQPNASDKTQEIVAPNVAVASNEREQSDFSLNGCDGFHFNGRPTGKDIEQRDFVYARSFVAEPGH